MLSTFLKLHNLEYLLVNSTNEFLVEYNTLGENSRYKLTNFSGSTGEALVTPETIYLFVDGRYHIQADTEVNHEKVTVVKLQAGQNYLEELVKKIPQSAVLGLFSKKNPQQKVEFLKSKFEIKLLDEDIFDKNNKIIDNNAENIELSKDLTGLTSDEKIKIISSKLKDDEAIFLTDLDEVSYLFNMRNLSQNYSSKVKAKAIIYNDKAELFLQKDLKNLDKILKEINKKVYIDKTSINAYDFNLLNEKAVEMKSNPVKQMKAQKTKEELEHFKDAFNKTDKALTAIRDFIENNDNLSEFDIAQQLEIEYKKQGAKNLSFQSIVAIDDNSAIVHYSKSSKDKKLKDGSLVLIDSGAYFEGGLATDITRVFVKGTPNKKQKFIYTTVLRAFLSAFNYAKTHSQRPVIGIDIHKEVAKFFDNIELDGFVFNHGLGHGIGINVHEEPPRLNNCESGKAQILDNMCFSIEPGLYKNGEFGVRLENSCYFKDDNIHSFVKMNYEQKLIDNDLLTEQEKQWLLEFEVR